MVKKINRWAFLSSFTRRVVSPSGDGKLPIIKIVRDKSGQIHEVVSGYSNIQERMNKEAKIVDLKVMLAEVESGKRSRVEGFSNASALPENKYVAMKRVESLIHKWDSNPLLRMAYKNKEELLKALSEKDGHSKVLARCKQIGDMLVNPIKEDVNNIKPVKEVSKEVAKEVVPSAAPVDGVKASEVK